MSSALRTKRSPRRSLLRLRLATLDDGARLLAWRNDAETRRQSFDRAKVPWADHLAWLTRKLADSRCRLYVALVGTRPVGQVRVERLSPSSAEVHIAVAPEARGRGLGVQMLRQVAQSARRALGIETLVAHIRPDNIGSVIAFVKAGFGFSRLVSVKGTRCYRLERSASTIRR